MKGRIDESVQKCINNLQLFIENKLAFDLFEKKRDMNRTTILFIRFQVPLF